MSRKADDIISSGLPYAHIKRLARQITLARYDLPYFELPGLFNRLILALIVHYHNLKIFMRLTEYALQTLANPTLLVPRSDNNGNESSHVY